MVVGIPHSTHPFTKPHHRSMKLLGQPEKNFRRMKHQCLQDEGVDCSSHRMRTFVWNFESFQRLPHVPNGVPIVSLKLCEKMDVEISYDTKLFQALPRKENS